VEESISAPVQRILPTSQLLRDEFALREFRDYVRPSRSPAIGADDDEDEDEREGVEGEMRIASREVILRSLPGGEALLGAEILAVRELLDDDHKDEDDDSPAPAWLDAREAHPQHAHAHARGRTLRSEEDDGDDVGSLD
jgi:hypothetical protein